MVEITEKEYELFQKLKKIWIHSSPEKSGAYFMCGEAGAKSCVKKWLTVWHFGAILLIRS